MDNSLTLAMYIEKLKNYFRKCDSKNEHAREIDEFFKREESYVKSAYEWYREGSSMGNPNAFAFSLEMEFGLPWLDENIKKGL